MESEKTVLSFVLFGGTGDLTIKKIIPAFAELVETGKISEKSELIGVSRRDFTNHDYLNFILERVPVKKKKLIEKLNIKYVKTNFSNPDLKKLKEVISKNRLYYLATSFKFFESIVQELSKVGLNKPLEKNISKIIFEKPFGQDLESAKKLNANVEKYFSENNIFRIDHYLGKRKVIELADKDFKKLAENITSLEIIMDESVGVENRLEYYNDIGAVKDMVQSHMLQVLALTLANKNKDLQSEKLKVLKSIEVLPDKTSLFGYYKGYKEEILKKGLKDKETETFVKIYLHSNIQEWNNTKICLRTGKKLDKKASIIKINFGKKLEELDLSSSGSEHVILINDVLVGKRDLFPTFEEIKESWRIADEILKMKDKIDFISYNSNKDLES